MVVFASNSRVAATTAAAVKFAATKAATITAAAAATAATAANLDKWMRPKAASDTLAWTSQMPKGLRLLHSLWCLERVERQPM
jgi:hypothetical protein